MSSNHKKRKEEGTREKVKDKTSEINTFTMDLRVVLLAPKNVSFSLCADEFVSISIIVYFLESGKEVLSSSG